jgi:hypothetical protein
VAVGRRLLLLLALVFVLEGEHFWEEDAQADEHADYLQAGFEAVVSVLGVTGAAGAGAAAAVAVVAAVVGLRVCAHLSAGGEFWWLSLSL